MSTTVNTTEQTLTVTTDHFSLWATMVRPLSFWEQSRMWFLITGVIVAGMLLALFLKSMRDEATMTSNLQKWEGEGYDLGDWNKRWGKK